MDAVVAEPDRRAEVAASAIERAEAAPQDITAAGFMDVRSGASAIGNSAGLFAYHAATSVAYSLTARTGDGTGSGWSGVGHREWSRVDSDAMHSSAIRKAVRSRSPRSLEPGSYPVILEPEAVADLIGLLVGSLDARSADEGRSAFSAPDGTRLGERVVADVRQSVFERVLGLDVGFFESTRTGEIITRAAARGLRDVSMECGGKNPALVFADHRGVDAFHAYSKDAR